MSGKDRHWAVQVLVVMARGLSKPSMTFKQSPYCTVTLIDGESEKRVRDKQYSKVHQDGNKSAIWNEFFSFKGSKDGLTDEEVRNFSLFVGIRSKYNVFQKCKLGDTSVELEKWMGKQSEEMWLDIFDAAGQVAGEVKIALSVLDLSKRQSGAHTEDSFKESLRRISKPATDARKVSMKMMRPEDMCGYLFKRGRGIHANWKQRYFRIVMSEDELKFDLEYFKHKSLADKSSNRQGVAVVVPESGVEICEIDNRKNAFKLTDTSGATLARTDNFYLQSESEDGARSWIKTIKELLDRINRVQREKSKIAVTQGAKMFLELPTKHKGVLFRNDEEHIGKIFAELHSDDSTSALILYDNEGDKLCDTCLELAYAVTTIACDELSLSIQLESGAKYVFRTVEEDAKTGSAVVGEWGLKLRESGCKLVKEKRLSRVDQVRKKRLRSKGSSSGSVSSTTKSRLGSRASEGVAEDDDDESKDDEDDGDFEDEEGEDSSGTPKTPMSPLDHVISKKFLAFSSKKKKKKEISPEERLRNLINSLWEKLRVVPKELSDLEHDKASTFDLNSLLVDYHTPEMVVQVKDGQSVVVTPPSTSAKGGDDTPGASIRRRSSSWKPHAGFMRFRQVMERRLHMCLKTVARPAVDCVHKEAKSNGVGASISSYASILHDRFSEMMLKSIIAPDLIAELCGLDSNSEFLRDVEDDSRESTPCAVYILSGRAKSLKALEKDFQPGKCRYAARVVLILLERPTEPEASKCLQRLLTSNDEFRSRLFALPSILNLVAVPVNLCAAICGGQRDAVKLLDIGSTSSDLSKNKLVNRVVHMLSGMNEWPIFRYSSRSEISKQFAIALNNRMRNYMGRESKFWYRGPLTNEPDPTMLIVDRSFDQISPLIRNRAFQGALFDHMTKSETLKNPIFQGQEENRVFRLFQTVPLPDVAKKCDGLVDAFRSGGRSLKSEAECDVAKQYADVAKKCIEVAGGESLFVSQIDLHREIAAGVLMGGGDEDEEDEDEEDGHKQDDDEWRGVLNSSRLHLRLIDEICTSAALLEEDAKSESIEKSIESLSIQTECLYIFSSVWRDFLRTGEIPSESQIRQLKEDIQQLVAEIASVESLKCDVDRMTKMLNEIPVLSTKLLRLYNKKCFAPRHYDSQKGETITSISKQLDVNADEIYKLNKHKFKTGFMTMWKKFTKDTMIKKPTRLTLPTYLDDELRYNASYANQSRKRGKPVEFVSRLVRAFQDVATGKLEDDHFPCVNKRMYISDGSTKPRVLLFVLGGISWFELLQLTNKAKEMNQPITVISTKIFDGANEYLDFIRKL